MKGTSIPIALVGAPDAGLLREDRPGLSLKVARDVQQWRYRRPVVQLRRVNAENLIHPVHPANRYSLITPPRISFRRNCAGSGSSIGSRSTPKVPGAC